MTFDYTFNVGDASLCRSADITGGFRLVSCHDFAAVATVFQRT